MQQVSGGGASGWTDARPEVLGLIARPEVLGLIARPEVLG